MIPRSHCPYCFQPLSIRDNIPLLSYLFLKRNHAVVVSVFRFTDPLVEITSSVLFILAASRFHPGLTLVAAWLLIAMLLVLAVIDCRTADAAGCADVIPALAWPVIQLTGGECALGGGGSGWSLGISVCGGCTGFFVSLPVEKG
ncbi:prepilin peptidase (plasmid) [Escherichia coli]